MARAKMSDTIARLYGSYRTDHPLGDPPHAIRMHYEDWYALLNEIGPQTGFLDTQVRPYRFMGMVPLLDPKWPKGFPVCLGTKGAAEAIQEGARQA